MKLVAFGIVASIATVACAPRVERASGSSTQTTGAGGSLGGGAVGGSGGGPFACTELAWSGDPVYINTGLSNATIRSIHLVHVDVDDYAITLEADVDTDAHAVGSVAVLKPFQLWPPSIGAVAIDASTDVRWTTSKATTGRFAFAGSDQEGAFTLGQVTPGQSLTTSVTWSAPGETATFLSASSNGSYLVGHGTSSRQRLTFLSALSGDPSPLYLGTVSCASSALLSAAVSVDAGQWLVASTIGTAGDKCPDTEALSPALQIQIQVASGGSVGDVSSETLRQTDSELVLAPAADGAWLGDGTTNYFNIQKLRSDGTFDLSLHFEYVSGEVFAGHDVAALGRTFVLADIPGEKFDQGSPMHLLLPTGLSDFFSLDATSLTLHPLGQPSLATSLDGGWVLVGFIDQGNQEQRIGLVRAQCVGAM